MNHKTVKGLIKELEVGLKDEPNMMLEANVNIEFERDHVGNIVEGSLCRSSLGYYSY